MDDVIIARALHVLGVVVWIGGVAMVTMVVLPALRRGDLGPNRLQVFEAIECRFGRHTRLATLVVGLTGFYMTQRLDLWDRFRSGGFWWMHAMVCLWLLFTLLLFVAEPPIACSASPPGGAATASLALPGTTPVNGEVVLASAISTGVGSASL